MRYNANTELAPTKECEFLKARVDRELFRDARQMVLHVQRTNPEFSLRALLEFCIRCGLEQLTKQFGDPGTAPDALRLRVGQRMR